MRGASNPGGRTAAPGLLAATRSRGRNDGQAIGSLVSGCRLTARGARSRFRARLSAPSTQRFHQISLSRSPGGTVEFRWPEGLHWSEVTRPVTTRDRNRPGFSFRGKRRTSTAPKGLRFPDEGARFFTTRNYEPRIRGEFYLSVATLALERRLANPSWFALPSVSGFRLVPSEQAPRLRRALSREPRDPGLPFRPKPKEFNNERRRRHKKTLRSVGSGGSVETDFPSHIKRDRSQESRVRS
jgi:hypothetical protein